MELRRFLKLVYSTPYNKLNRVYQIQKYILFSLEIYRIFSNKYNNFSGISDIKLRNRFEPHNFTISLQNINSITCSDVYIGDTRSNKAQSNKTKIVDIEENELKKVRIVDTSNITTPVLRLSRKYNSKHISPSDIVQYLDEYIIGQTKAKRAVANALINRLRRKKIKDVSLRSSIIPKNILLIGPTGVGKTEIARRLSQFVDAPFIKVEATRFTEVGFHGKDVDNIIKDLAEISLKRQKLKLQSEMREFVEKIVEKKLLEAILISLSISPSSISTNEWFFWLQHIRHGYLNDKVIDICIPDGLHLNKYKSICNLNEYSKDNNGIFNFNFSDDVYNIDSNNIDEKSSITTNYFTNRHSGNLKYSNNSVENQVSNHIKVTVAEARSILIQNEINSILLQDSEFLMKRAIESTEQEGIVFIDEIDKICIKRNSHFNGPDASSEGVQRDLLSLIEGTVVATKIGDVKTDDILFIASGAFHNVKSSDMIAELQGRLPIKAELEALVYTDYIRILKEPKYSLLKQYSALLDAENIYLTFTDDSIEEMARIAFELNSYTENIGARRLHMIVEAVTEDITFNTDKYQLNSIIFIDKSYVINQLNSLILRYDLQKYIL
ncbi:heat shock protein HslVU, ATPase subunit HslU, putative [Cryptosporidium muris RN66]|uniref:Heat shock protein HslVU, ATPase subunit HslU, putative n=1 Tax=Cryptosporidium muris (strain RN66) TaxID=441375 RepID=B6AJS4_CRYMR|nr:heat shock protein HslVU, ATPase subunit HslU, putative [Cryptosporidium muris RN66]EEA08465.1 heat shock protein HslVU, ATPase subunit HslU, putative [Cryptosporidium muris RN66]|eukprot:XP_002142814.1 heat shock protein HslVU, ATPase subunit HslU [Cryptosporidium muris RN66]